MPHEAHAQRDGRGRSSRQKDLEAAEAAKTQQHAVAKPAIRGPRVVQAGREHRTGTVVSVGPTDIFLEFGPGELGSSRLGRWPEDKVPPKKDDMLEVVVNSREPDESLFLCSRPGSVQKADWELLEAGQVIERARDGA